MEMELDDTAQIERDLRGVSLHAIFDDVNTTLA